MSKKPRDKFDLEKFRASAQRRQEEAKKLWASIYGEPVYLDEAELEKAKAAKIPEATTDAISKASDALRERTKRMMDLATLGFDPRSTNPTPNESHEEMRARYLLQSRGMLADFASYMVGAPSGPTPNWDALEKALEGEFPKGLPDQSAADEAADIDEVTEELFRDAPEGEDDPV